MGQVHNLLGIPVRVQWAICKKWRCDQYDLRIKCSGFNKSFFFGIIRKIFSLFWRAK
jgi:hypothetical protein